MVGHPVFVFYATIVISRWAFTDTAHTKRKNFMREFLKKALPWIGTAASAATGTPFPAMAAKAVSAALGGKEVKPDLESIGKAVQEAMLSPEKVVELHKADQDFALQMGKLNIENIQILEQLANADRDSARKREMTVKDRMPMILGLSVTIGFFSILIYVMAQGVKTGSEEVVYLLMGSLAAAFGGIVQYYFGSSAGSAEKSRIMAQNSNGNGTK
jgi:hypothetical protein